MEIYVRISVIDFTRVAALNTASDDVTI